MADSETGWAGACSESPQRSSERGEEWRSWVSEKPPVQPEDSPQDVRDAEVPLPVPTTPSTPLPFHSSGVDSSDTCLDFQGKSHTQADPRRQSLMEGHGRTTSLNLVCSHQKIPGEERAPGAVWTVKGKSKVAALEPVLTRGSGTGLSWTKQGQEDTHGAQAEGSQWKTVWKCCSTGRGRGVPPEPPSPTGSTESADVAGRQGHSRLGRPL